MTPKCKVCDTEMQLRNGRFGAFYFCPKSRARDLHGTINKAEYDVASTASLANVYRADSEDRQMLEHLRRIEKAAGETVVDFFTDHQMSADEGDPEMANILPKG
jgi:ssDNA-binding Zn-finger/Zn-ribbon topoisomerase 1